jgi:FAD dependent oxidoreductase TIGR03364
MTAASNRFDLAVIGAGILGLSCALAAAQRGLKVIVIERGARALGASVRNFGLVTITGQDRDGVWPRARRSREVWSAVAARAGIPIVNRGQWISAQRPEAAAVLDAFLRTDMAEGCELLTPATARRRCPELCPPGLEAVLWSPHELRVESRDAIPALAGWLAREHGVSFRWETAGRAHRCPGAESSPGTGDQRHRRIDGVRHRRRSGRRAIRLRPSVMDLCPANDYCLYKAAGAAPTE